MYIFINLKKASYFAKSAGWNLLIDLLFSRKFSTITVRLCTGYVRSGIPHSIRTHSTDAKVIRVHSPTEEKGRGDVHKVLDPPLRGG